MIDQVFPPLPAQIDVDVGKITAMGVEEPFEAQLMADRINLGDAESIGDDGSGSRPAPRTGDAEASGFIDDLPDDEKVRDETHFVDDLQLAGQTFEHWSLHFSMTSKKALMAALVELTVSSLSLHLLHRRKDGLCRFCRVGTAVAGEELRSGQRFREIAVALTPFGHSGNR